MNTPFAEVIQSTLTSYTAQCWEWDNTPSFGSLIQVSQIDKTVFGLVTSVSTGSSDPMRTPFAYKKTEAQLRAEQPHIFEFLQTNFTVHVVGYEEKNGMDSGSQPGMTKVRYLIPPTPCKIHSFVSACDQKTLKRFFVQPDFLQPLFSFANTIQCFDELLLAVINHLADNKIVTKHNIDEFCKLFSLMTGNDYRRLKIFLKRVEPLLG